MAEAALFSIASKVLSTMASPAFEKAYERARSIWGAKDELKELKETITSIQAVLLDAEKQHHNDSAGVKNWIGRVREVLYDAEDLFDVVVTEDLLTQQIKGKKPLKPVRVFFSKLNPIASRDFISKKAKAIRNDLRRISDDMAHLGFVKCESENFSTSVVRKRVETGSYVDSEDIIGRNDEKMRVIDFVFNVDRTVSLISIVGIGGMGKSALAQIVYNDPKIKAGFENRYWACISDIFDEKEVLGKINQSMTGRGNYQEFSFDQLQSSVRESINGEKKFLLVLDDLWDEDTGRGSKLLSILSSGHAQGSKIIVTTRHLSVAKAMRADDVLELQGLSWDESWALFRRYAFSKDQENDPTWIRVGEKIARKCLNVPLTIKSIACLLSTKDTIGEWRSLENEQLSRIQVGENSIMSTLRLSYDHLPSHLKNCFAYCSLFPKDCELQKETLIYLWIAQGYMMPKDGETLEMAGHACFMELLRRCFFQEPTSYESEIIGCKMHDLIHDLAEDVAGEESCIITHQGKGQSHSKIRHLCVDYVNGPMNIDNPLLLLNADRLRTCLYTSNSCIANLLDEQFMKFRFLRVLSLRDQGIRDVPSSIGEMKYLRYLDLLYNSFTHLPDSITKLVNLVTLDLSCCDKLVRMPKDLGELISLRHLRNNWCIGLLCMPPTLGKLTSLEHLSYFKVTTNDVVVDGELCMLDALARLNLRGNLSIIFNESVEWCKDEVFLEKGHVPDSLEALSIHYYPSMRMGAWWTDINPSSGLYKLELLNIGNSEHVKHLPPLRCLPCLTSLYLSNLPSLEYIEDDEIVPTTPFFPSLCSLKIWSTLNLKGWSRPTNAVLSAAPNALIFPCLSKLEIRDCPNITSTSMPISAPCLKSIDLYRIKGEVVEQLVSGPSASSVEKIVMQESEDLTTFSGEGLTSLRSLSIVYCENLSKVRVAPNTVEEFSIQGCPKMELWEERGDDEMSVDWPSFSNLHLLTLKKGEEGNTRLPDCLQQLVSLGKLQVQSY